MVIMVIPSLGIQPPRATQVPLVSGMREKLVVRVGSTLTTTLTLEDTHERRPKGLALRGLRFIAREQR